MTDAVGEYCRNVNLATHDCVPRVVFLRSQRSELGEIRGGSQELEITVKGGYSPDVIRVREGLPVRLIFNRQESSDCTARVVFPDFGVSKALPAFGKTVVEFTPRKSGEFTFACGMNMIHGALVVEREVTDLPRATRTEDGPQEEAAGGISAELQSDEDSETASRRLEMRDLAWRVATGAILTLPTVYAVMAGELFGLPVPAWMHNPFVQLMLIGPVFLYTGWPIHCTGWLALSRRTADMNSLITLGTTAAFVYSRCLRGFITPQGFP